MSTAILALTLFLKEFKLILQKVRSESLIITLLTIVLWFPLYHWEISGAAYRFFHVGVLLTPLLFLFLINSFPFRKGLAITAITIFCGLSLVSWKSYAPAKQDPSYALYGQVTKKLSSIVNHQKPELIIAHKSLAEYFTYSTGIDAMPWIPDYPIDKAKLWRIAVLPFPQLYTYYTQSKATHLISHYYYVSEYQWQEFMMKMKESENTDLLKEHLTWQNPNEVRPDFLRKKNSSGTTK